MNFNKHFDLEGKHARLSASSWRWLNDDAESLTKRLCSQYATEIGTLLHEVARKHIEFNIKLNKYDKKNVMLELLAGGIPGFVIDTINFDDMYDNLMAYVNDCVGYKMEPEVVLCYSKNFFGTADAIHYSDANRFLRIHDYKSGVTPAHMEQLMIYAALFCLEYHVKPAQIEIELRIYQSGEVICHNPDPDEITHIMDTIITIDKYITSLNEGV